jgi:hypothetical protein
MVVRRDDASDGLGPPDQNVFPVPDQLPAPGGGSLVATVDDRRALGTLGKIGGGGLAVIGGLGGVAFTVGSLVSLANGSPNTSSTATASASGQVGSGSVGTTQTGRASDFVALGVGVGLLALGAAGVVWFLHAREGSLDFAAPENAVAGRRGARAGLARIVATPAGLGIAF